MSLFKTPPAQTIDQVVERLDEIVAWSLAGASRLGYFAGLYRRVTITIRDLIRQGGYFDDDARMERLDVVFANRYLNALDDYLAHGSACTAPWRVAFDEVGSGELIILQQLMLGMNAHIELDLGVAVAEVAPGEELPAIKGDFDKINTVLAALSPLVEQEIGALSPMIHLAEKIGHSLERPIVDLALCVARSSAWQVAEELAPLDAPARERVIARRAAQVAGWSQDIADPALLAEVALKVVASVESHDVRKIVHCLSKPETIEFEGRPLKT